MEQEKETLTRDFAEERKKQIGDVKYDLFLKFLPKNEKYSGKCKIKFHLNEINKEVVLESISEIKFLLVNGKKVNYQKTKFLIKLKDGLKSGSNDIEIDYEANYDHTGDGLHQFIDSEDGSEYIYSNFEPYEAHKMFPCFDQPDIKATLKLTVESPKNWKVISNEVGEERNQGERKIVYFKETKKISTYLFHLSLGNYEFVEDSYNGISLRIYFRKSMNKYVRHKETFKITKQGLKFYSEFFDYPYPFSKYDQIFVPEFNSLAMENPGAVTFSEKAFFVRHEPTRTDKSLLANVILHEMAHMWFGDLVTMKWWDDLWLNESFADFISYFSMIKATEFNEAWGNFYARKNWGYFQDQLITTHPIAADASDTDVAFSNFDGISYAKGAAVLKQLMFYIGEDNFRNGLRNYFKKYEWKNTELKDFLGCLEEAFGKKLDKWFDSWIKTTGVNSIIAEFDSKSLNIIQKPSDKNNLLRSHKTEIAIFDRNLNPKVKEIIYSENKTEIKNLNLNKKELGFVFLNYNDWDYVKDKFEDNSLKFILENLSKIDDDLTRQMIYGTLWQTVRDAEIDPRKFLDLVLINSQKEKNLLLLERMFLQTKSIITNYINKNVKDYCDKFFDLSMKMLNSNISSEMKNAWFGMLIFVSSWIDSNKIEKLADILNGKIIFDDFEFDQDKKWGIVIKLESLGNKRADEFLKREMDKDNSDIGEKKAAVAEASKLVNKKKFWNLYISGEGKSLDYIRESMSGFYWANQKENLREYIDIFFKDIKKVFEKHDKQYARAFFDNLFPSIYVEDETLKRARKYLEELDEEQKLLKKFILEAIDNLERALKVLNKYG